MNGLAESDFECQESAEQRSPELRVSVLGESDGNRWDSFVTEQGGSFYHLVGWRRIIESQLGHRSFYLVCEQAGQIRGVLPLVQVKSRLFGNALISVPFLVNGGPLSLSAEAESALIERAVDIAENLGVDRIELRSAKVPGTIAETNDWYVQDTHVTFRKEISDNPEANMMAIPRKQRAMIRKGIKAGLSFEVDDDVDRLYPAMLECKRNLGTPFFGRRYLGAIKDEFGDAVEILTVLHDQAIVCSVMSFRYRDQILPYYGGGGDLARTFKGNDFMYWCVMEKACQEGVKWFDFGRSQIDSGAYRFKKHWGFEPEPLAYRTRLVRADGLPDLSPSSPKYRMAVQAWKRLPLPVAAAIGPFLAARLG